MANAKRKLVGAVKCIVGLAQATACSVTATFNQIIKKKQIEEQKRKLSDKAKLSIVLVESGIEDFFRSK